MKQENIFDIKQVATEFAQITLPAAFTNYPPRSTLKHLQRESLEEREDMTWDEKQSLFNLYEMHNVGRWMELEPIVGTILGVVDLINRNDFREQNLVVVGILNAATYLGFRILSGATGEAILHKLPKSLRDD